MQQPSNSEQISAALIKIEALLDEAERARQQLENDAAGSNSDNAGSFELPSAALESNLEQAAVLLSVLLERVNLPGMQAQLSGRWHRFERKENGIGKTEFFHEVDYLQSRPLSYLRSLVNGVRLFAGNETSSYVSYELAKLESMLRNTAVLVYKRGAPPANEKDVREIMHDYLGAVFVQYTRSVQIPAPLKNFKPDGGVINLEAAIEFKFADTKEKVSVALGGIFEDISGYAGSKDWTRFYSVVYQTQPFVSEESVASSFERAAAKNWTVILVTGGSAAKKLATEGTSPGAE